MYASVVVDRPIHRRPPPGADARRAAPDYPEALTYRLPERLRGGDVAAAVGHLVQVPLGNSSALGLIVALAGRVPHDLPPTVEIRDVIEILDPLPVVTPAQIALARWIAAEYLTPVNSALSLMLPPGLEERTFVVVQRAAENSAALAVEEALALRLVPRGRRLRLGSLLRQIAGQTDDPEAVIHSLAERGIITIQPSLVPPLPAPPRVQFVRLLADDEAIAAALPHLGNPSKQADVLLALAHQSDAPLTLNQICRLAGCSPAPVRALEERGWVEITGRRTLLAALPGASPAAVADNPEQAAALAALLARGGIAEVESLARGDWAGLEKRGQLRRIKEEPLALLRLDADEVLARIIALRRSEKQRAVLQALRDTAAAGRVWAGGLYADTGANLATLRSLAARGLISLHAEEYDRPLAGSREQPVRLSAEQQAACAAIAAELGRRPPGEPPFVALLHGVTGSGKTEIYLHALQATLAAGRRAMVLVPEISLTPQTVQRFEAHFPGRVAVIHGQLSLGQRYAAWDRARRGEADVVIGSRSALFAPLSRLGLIVLDEVHDASYKQDEPIPRPAYHARDVAVALAGIVGATVILGSATPDLVSYARASGLGGGFQPGPAYQLLELSQRVVASSGPGGVCTSPLPPVQVVDLRQELRAGNRGILSRALQDALQHCLAAGEQAILFLNRRGTSTFVLCRDCGHVVVCPACDIPLTFHQPPAEPGQAPAPGRLVCHHCNHRQPTPSTCPACRGRRIRYFGLGTEGVEEAVRAIWPEARLLRWDSDTAGSQDHERLLQAFVEQRADILVGTQMIAKGLDLPRVTLAGVVSADTALYLPDYRAAERTFQLLTQVAGRAGRSDRGGQAVVQTYNPEHYAIQAAAQHDYRRFYAQEMAYRRRLGYPPFSRLVALRYSHTDAYRCRVEAKRLGTWLAAEIRKQRLPLHLIGPVPCFFDRLQGRSRWQIVVRGHDPTALLRGVILPQGWTVDVDPESLL